MTTILMIIAALAIILGAVFLLMKSGKIQDKDGDNIPDVIEEKIEDAKEQVAEIKKRVEVVKEEVGDVVNAVNEIKKQAKQVVSAAKGEPRKGRPRKK